jgi:hypothetical protein
MYAVLTQLACCVIIECNVAFQLSETTAIQGKCAMQKYDTPAPVTAVVDIPAGQIRLIATDRADTTVEVRPADPASRRDVKAAELRCRARSRPISYLT